MTPTDTTNPPRFELLRTRLYIIMGLLKRRDSKFVTSYLKGLRGIEIGASAHNRYYLDAINVDRWGADDTKYKREERRLALHTAKVDVVAPGDDLPFGDDSVDFVFASHVIEHFPDPIRALYEWVRVAQRYVVLIVPHRDRTFDADRPLTSAEELLTRHREGFTSEEDMHWSVWTCESFIELCDQIGLPVVDHLDPDDKVGNGFAVVIDASVKPTPRSSSAGPNGTQPLSAGSAETPHPRRQQRVELGGVGTDRQQYCGVYQRREREPDYDRELAREDRRRSEGRRERNLRDDCKPRTPRYGRPWTRRKPPTTATLVSTIAVPIAAP